MGISLTDDCWGLWPERGFLPSSDPMSHLSQYPDARNYLETNTIDHLEKLSQELEGALANKTFSGSIDTLPMLDTSSMVRLSANNHLIERTLLLYSNFANAYVFEDPDKPKKILPSKLAVPLFELSEKVGRRPILSYASYIHYNWKRTDPNKGIVLENLELNQKLQGGVHEKWFVLVHVEIEAIASKMLLELRACIADGLAPGNLQRTFETVTSGIMQMIQTFKRMDEHCTPYEYYHQVRPYIFGFDDLEFEGIPGVQAERMYTLRGQAASQSSIIPSLVAFLGIHHHESGNANHLADTRTYMPKEHQKIILGFVQPNVREVVLSAEKSDDLIVAYNDAINTLSKFRSLHLANVKRYIFEFSQDENDLGTGKTVFLKWLAKLRDETNAAMISV